MATPGTYIALIPWMIELKHIMYSKCLHLNVTRSSRDVPPLSPQTREIPLAFYYRKKGTCGYGEGLSGPINAGNFLTSCKVYWLASQEGLCSME